MSLYIHPERTRVLPERKSRFMIPVIIWIAIIAAVMAIVTGLSGCATPQQEPVAQVCYVRIMGQTEEDYTMVMQACQTPEKFAESQQ